MNHGLPWAAAAETTLSPRPQSPIFAAQTSLRLRPSAGLPPRRPAIPRTALRPAPRAASDLQCRAVRKSPRNFPTRHLPEMSDIERWRNLNDDRRDNKRDFVTSDEPNSSIEIAGPAAAGDPAADGVAGVRARRVAAELPPRRARPRAQPVGDQPSDPRAGIAVRREAVCPRRALGAVDRGWGALSRQGLLAAARVAGLAQRGRDGRADPARTSLARQRPGDAGGRGARPWRYACHGAPDQGATGIWQKAGGAVRCCGP